MFKKYPSIENSYREKTINMFLEKYPQLKNETYIVQEKLDGANIQFIFSPDGSMQIASRNRIIDPDENFYSVWDVIYRDEYKKLIEAGKGYARFWGYPVHIYGELYGKGIQKRIDYGDDRYISIFDMSVTTDDNNNVIFPPIYLMNSDVSDYIVKNYGVFDSLQEALDFVPNNWNNIEGVVIKPYHNVYYSPQGSIFYLKNKNPNFEEKGNKPKKEKKQNFSDSVEHLHSEFGKYINENRVLSVFSKMGEIQDDKQIGEYIKAVIEDAKNDFIDDGNSVDSLDQKEIKYVYNHSKSVVQILRKYL